MITDIFSNRYAEVILWQTFEEKDRQFLVQAFRIVNEQLSPSGRAGRRGISEQTAPKVYARMRDEAEFYWWVIHDKLSMELGLKQLSRQTSAETQYSTLCRKFILAAYDGSIPADRFMKDRLSFIEIAFRQRAEDLELGAAHFADLREQALREPTGEIRLLRGGTANLTSIEAWQTGVLRDKHEFRDAVIELNGRIRQAGYELHYHNGFIQRSTDPAIEHNIEGPFWDAVAEATWKNVDIDMKEAIDRRDNGDRDPAFYAARALETTIKIISDKKRLTYGGEKGAHNYIDSLGSKKAGPFIESWERDMLKDFFTRVRNPLGHGPGNEKMAVLGPEQTDWAIETCMSWIKSLNPTNVGEKRCDVTDQGLGCLPNRGPLSTNPRPERSP